MMRMGQPKCRKNLNLWIIEYAYDTTFNDVFKNIGSVASFAAKCTEVHSDISITAPHQAMQLCM